MNKEPPSKCTTTHAPAPSSIEPETPVGVPSIAETSLTSQAGGVESGAILSGRPHEVARRRPLKVRSSPRQLPLSSPQRLGPPQLVWPTGYYQAVAHRECLDDTNPPGPRYLSSRRQQLSPSSRPSQLYLPQTPPSELRAPGHDSSRIVANGQRLARRAPDLTCLSRDKQCSTCTGTAP